MHIRTIAAIIVWVVVALLFINRAFRSEWVLPVAIILTIIALVVYFSPHLKSSTQKYDRSNNDNSVKEIR